MTQFISKQHMLSEKSDGGEVLFASGLQVPPTSVPVILREYRKEPTI